MINDVWNMFWAVSQGYQMFGKNAGCGLLTSSCTSYMQTSSKAREWFCSADQDLKCGHDHRFVGKCRDQRPYNTCRIASPMDVLGYQFAGSTSVKTSSWCTDPANNAGVRPDGQHFGQFSRCIEVSEKLAYEAGRRGRHQVMVAMALFGCNPDPEWQNETLMCGRRDTTSFSPSGGIYSPGKRAFL